MEQQNNKRFKEIDASFQDSIESLPKLEQHFKYTNPLIREELHSWRESFTIEQAKSQCRSTKTPKFSCAILCSGGCLDTLSAIRAGFFPLWGCETDPDMQDIWRDLTGVPSMGDFTKINPKYVRRPMVIKTGCPCQDWSPLGKQQGTKGNSGGNLYVAQGKIILDLEPIIAVIEQTAGVLQVEKGKWFYQLAETLGEKYILHYRVLDCWKYGDVSNRKRLFLIALHKRLGEAAKAFRWPTEKFSDKFGPNALDIAVPDSEVQNEDMCYGEPVNIFSNTEPRPGHIHHIGSFDPDGAAGDSETPGPLHSQWGLPATQLCSNGGSRRVLLTYKPGDSIYRTRKTTIVETCRIASLSISYLQWLRSKGYTDRFIRKLINNGVPCMTATAIDMECANILSKTFRADVPPTIHEPISHQLYADMAIDCGE